MRNNFFPNELNMITACYHMQLYNAILTAYVKGVFMILAGICPFSFILFAFMHFPAFFFQFRGFVLL